MSDEVFPIYRMNEEGHIVFQSWPVDKRDEIPGGWTDYGATYEQNLAAHQCYQACRAINPDAPVKVAEALPELIEAAEKSAHLLKNHFEADPEGMGTTANDAALRTLTALAKLKAQP